MTDEAVSASLMQDEASELEYCAGVAELRYLLQASSPTAGEATAAPLSSANSGGVLHTSASAPPPACTFRSPQLEITLFAASSENEFVFSEFKLSLNNAFRRPLE